MRIPLLLYALALGVRLVLIALYPDPAYADSSYYVEVARSLAAGRGLTVDYVWIFAEVGGRIPVDPMLPIPSNAHWLPLPSLLQAPFVALLGPTAWASALPGALIGALAAPLTWFIARDVGATRLTAIAASVLAIVPAAATVFMGQPDNFAIFHPLLAATLWLAARGMRGDPRAYVLSGLLVGFATIARNDGMLLGGVVGLMFVVDRWRSWRGGDPARIPVAAAIGCFALFLLVAGPWFVRQLLVFGSISPTASDGQALWLTDYAQWNSVTAETSLSAFLAQGWAAILGSRLIGLGAVGIQFVVYLAAVVLVIPLAIGAWHRRHSRDFLPWFTFVAVLVLADTFVFPLHVPGGAFIHTAVGLAPHMSILAVEGIAVAIGWIALRRPGWDAARATPLFTVALVGLTVVTGLFYALAVHVTWDARREPRLELAAAMNGLGAGADDRLLSVDPGGLHYFTGRPGVVTTSDPLDTIEQIARAYDIRWLVLERADVVPALVPVLVDDERPAWIGPRVFEVAASDGRTPRLALYAVCVRPDDARCAAEAGP